MVCFLCSSPHHSASRCSELAFPLKDGFQSDVSGASSGEGHSHDDERSAALQPPATFGEEEDQRSFGRATHLTVCLAGFSDSTDFSELAGLEERELLGLFDFEFGLDDCLDDDND